MFFLVSMYSGNICLEGDIFKQMLLFYFDIVFGLVDAVIFSRNETLRTIFHSFFGKNDNREYCAGMFICLQKYLPTFRDLWALCIARCSHCGTKLFLSILNFICFSRMMEMCLLQCFYVSNFGSMCQSFS
jgi:hypothetical protein